MDYTVIGGSDGPTSIFLAGKLDIGWLNVWGLFIVVLIMLPNIVYAVKFPGVGSKCKNKLMNVLEQIGRYGCMVLMVCSIGMDGFGFSSLDAFLLYLFGNTALLLGYWIVWLLFFHRRTFAKSMALAILPTLIFLLSGLCLGHLLLIACAVLFGIAHIYITYQNGEKE